jgi:hypothetical protein
MLGALNRTSKKTRVYWLPRGISGGQAGMNGEQQRFRQPQKQDQLLLDRSRFLRTHDKGAPEH